MGLYITRTGRAKAVRYSTELDDDVMDETIIVHERDDEPVWTGLCDAQGNDLYRVHERHPIGFCLQAKSHKVKG